MKKENKFPEGWDEKRVHRVIADYESQSEEEAVVKDEAAYADKGFSMVEVPVEVLPRVRTIIAEFQAHK